MRWAVAAAGFAWPFGVALAGVGLTAAGVELSDPAAHGLFVAGFLGVPVAAAGTAWALPRSWATWARVAVALVVAAPLALAAVYAAFVAFVLGYVVAGGYVPA